MFYLDNKSGSKTMPMPQDKVSDEPLWFVEDKDAPSYPGADWFNIVTLELINILKLGGVSPDKFKFNQIALVLAELMAAQSRIVASINEGLAKTADGEYFSVPQGVESENAFIYYRNNDGIADVVSALAGEAALQKLRNEIYDLRTSEQVLQPLLAGQQAFAITDSDGKAALTIDENAVVEIFNLLVSAGKVRLKNGGVLADVVNTIFDSGDAAFAIADSSNAYALKIDFDGTTHIVKLQLKEPSSMTFENNKTLQDYLPEEIEVIDTAFAIVDEKDKYPLRIKNDGTVDIQKLAINEDKTVLSDGRTLADALSQGGEESKGHFDIQLVSGALYARDLNTQKRYLIKDSGVTSAEIESEHVVFKVGSDDFYAALPDGKVFKRFPSMRLSCIGDSLTNGYINGVDTDAYPFKLGALLNIPVEKRGWSGRASGDIALRMGATVVKLTVTGNTIPASGAVVVTLVDPATGYRSGMLDNYPEGTLAGVTGTLSRSESNVWTFTRKTAGSAVPCPPGSEYLHNGYPTANDGMVITWMGRNNYESMFAEVMRDQQQFTQWITTLNKQQIVIGITNTADEPRGSANYDAIRRVNSELAAAYPGRYFDAMRYLIDHGLSDAGITPTAQDLTDISKDIIPSSLRIDNTHFNAVGYQLIANQLYQLIQQLGWK
ncbi:hypothetical protein OHY99_15930 [Serratia marcescens]|uniref:hypothetical protein n=1 Tax=Serratia marcescens TaxID=615 RepID=UPI002220518F|nr:hypothetical protein [Serratia marcescens]UYU02362.1 hypothetical protein OHY99_15930 [Serratia marcescens]BEM86486.1 hypothetical protein SME46J_09560 [Serratia marcescens]